MQRRILFPAWAVLLTVTCSVPGGASPAGELAYYLPETPSATYRVADTLHITVDSPMGPLTIGQRSVVTLAMAFERGEGGIRVTADVEDFNAVLDNPMGGPLAADESHVEGSLVFVMGRRGEVELLSTPKVAGPGAVLSSFSSLAYGIFPRLPARAVEPGESWVDTVTWSGSEGPAEVSSTSVYTYTLLGDTLVDGRTLLHISVSGDAEVITELNQDGNLVEQRVSGTEAGFVLWDAGLGLLYASDVDRQMSGTMSFLEAGIPAMSLEVRGPARTRLEN